MTEKRRDDMSNDERDAFDKATLAREKEEQAGKRVSLPSLLSRAIG